jgi:hypothetical protein
MFFPSGHLKAKAITVWASFRSITHRAYGGAAVRILLAILAITAAGRVTVAAFGLSWHGFDFSAYIKNRRRQGRGGD